MSLLEIVFTVIALAVLLPLAAAQGMKSILDNTDDGIYDEEDA